LREIEPEEITMTSLVTILAVVVAVAFTAPAFAGEREDCEKAGDKWVEADTKCEKKAMPQGGGSGAIIQKELEQGEQAPAVER
jgi:hypothetical protein